jgi:hypothetical protein
MKGRGIVLAYTVTLILQHRSRLWAVPKGQ